MRYIVFSGRSSATDFDVRAEFPTRLEMDRCNTPGHVIAINNFKAKTVMATGISPKRLKSVLNQMINQM